MISSPAFQEYVHSPAFLHALDLPFNSSLNFSPLGQGEYNTNYRFSHPVTGKELVLRINTGSQMHLKDQIGYEFSALNTTLEDSSSSGFSGYSSSSGVSSTSLIFSGSAGNCFEASFKKL